MQGNSKYLRWSPLYTCCCIFVILSSTVIAVPVRSRRMVRETFSFDATNSNTISNETCFHDGVEVQKSSVTCEIKTGCKLIQKTGECCPDYQCSCNHEDRTYENGEKIVSHNPCFRCLCKGGEVTCNDVSCYIRDDCKPRYVKGVCCPTFDNCPPIDDAKIAATKEAESKTTKNDLIISLTTTTAGSSTIVEKNPMLQLANDNPLGIKIKEITKPEEIRITDDKPKPYNPFKSTTTTTTTASIPTTAESTVEAITKFLSTTETSSTSTISSISTELPRDSYESSTVDTNQSSGEHESRDYMDDGVLGDDRLSSSDAPPTKASAKGEVEPQLLLVSADSNTIGDDVGNKSVRQTTENSTNDGIDQSSESSSEFFSSTTTDNPFQSSTSTFSESPSTENNGGEEIDLVSSTPKNLVVVRHGGKTESFHISGVDELQRVEELDVISSTTENSQEIGDSAIKLTNDEFNLTVDSNEGKSSEELVMDGSSTTTGTPELFDDNDTVSWKINKNLENTLNSSESSTEPNNSIESSTQGVENSSEILSSAEHVYGTVYYPEEKSTVSPSSEEAIDTVFYSTTEGPFDASSSTTDNLDANSSSEPNFTSTTLAPVTAEPLSTPKSTTTESFSGSTSRFSYEDEESILENPEYPPIPDDLSLTHKDDEEEKRRLPNKAEENISSSTSGPCQECDADALKSVELSTRGPSLENIKLSHKIDNVESRAPGEPHLIPEWERTTTTTEKMEESTTLGPNDMITGANDISKTTIFDKLPVAGTKVNKSEALTNIETLPNVVDSEEKYGNKEPTTERPTTKGYANFDSEEGSAASSAKSEFDNSTGTSPKDDAESIKLNSSSSDENTNEQYSSLEEPSFIPKSFQNYWRFIEKNGWSARK
ncbi:flocculation protein FLO11 [Contarinia nasturtii]|uniref:flocculation protein FLO11 n=1 Tax=Contarinia nasturtii TaxID=265458 RepID=UPI0012D48704|nr:flocculation protein FLO11 [Contarinia nasturtii]XP_031623753.1 flocculation protein FLO11 [Contarinia nasturtii]XP_031623754.1 flocculation protein FLO11 [Contarinia nasturtii]